MATRRRTTRKKAKSSVKSSYRRMTVHEQRGITARYKSGDSLDRIARHYGIDRGTVRSIAKRNGAKIRPVGRPKGT